MVVAYQEVADIQATGHVMILEDTQVEMMKDAVQTVVILLHLAMDAEVYQTMDVEVQAEAVGLLLLIVMKYAELPVWVVVLRAEEEDLHQVLADLFQAQVEEAETGVHHAIDL